MLQGSVVIAHASMPHKDLFSLHSKIYATFRPVYPEDLYNFIYQHLTGFTYAWDCATGNGQVARYLTNKFEKIFATDISAQQISSAFQDPKIKYSISSAEATVFSDNQFDLITVAQALHWFDRHRFYQEARRVGNVGALLAVWGYTLLTVSPEIDRVFLDFYHHTVGPYWDEARKLVEDEYKAVEFPFEQIQTPPFQMAVDWNRDQFTGYLLSWSATQKFIKERRINPLDAFAQTLAPYWKAEEVKRVTFPVFMKLGRIKK